jgi:hypothetical protein
MKIETMNLQLEYDEIMQIVRYFEMYGNIADFEKQGEPFHTISKFYHKLRQIVDEDE